MFKKVLVIVLVVVGLLVLTEIIQLWRLKSSVDQYSVYWQNLSSSGEFVYVVLGDSAAQSIGASSPQKGYVGLLADQIEQKTGKQARIINLSVSGATVNDVTEKQLPQIANYKPDLITVEVGGNDVVRTDLSSFESDYRKLGESLPEGTFVATIPYFGGRIRKNNEAIKASDIIVNIAKENSLKVVDLQTETKQRDSLFNYSADWFHSSDKGYEVWADTFWREIAPTL